MIQEEEEDSDEESEQDSQETETDAIGIVLMRTQSGPGGAIGIPQPYEVLSQETELTLLSAPTMPQCYAIIKNLDDPKLIAYYPELDMVYSKAVDDPVTRRDFVKMIAKATGYESYHIDLTILDTVTDLSKESEYAPYFAYVLGQNFMNGQYVTVDTRAVRPDDFISREEAAKVLVRVFRKEDVLPTADEIDSFIDIDAHDKLAPYVQKAYDACLLHGKNTYNGVPLPGEEGRKFKPYDFISVAETAKILYNMTKES